MSRVFGGGLIRGPDGNKNAARFAGIKPLFCLQSTPADARGMTPDDVCRVHVIRVRPLATPFPGRRVELNCARLTR